MHKYDKRFTYKVAYWKKQCIYSKIMCRRDCRRKDKIDLHVMGEEYVDDRYRSTRARWTWDVWMW